MVRPPGRRHQGRSGVRGHGHDIAVFADHADHCPAIHHHPDHARRSHHDRTSDDDGAQAGRTPPGPDLGRPRRGAAQFTDPASGAPGLVLQPVAGTFVAFNAICPHAGCTVAFARSSDIIACPCHGSEFNARTGAVEQGPATRGLTRIPVAAADGNLYVDG